MRFVRDSGCRYKKYLRNLAGNIVQTEVVITDPEGTIVLSQDIEETEEGRDVG
jgi:hypothetical protein